MSDDSSNQDAFAGTTREDILEALFADLVARQTNLTLMFLGKIKDPKSGQPAVDLEAAQMFIDQLDMLEVKTRGNLSRHEDKFLKETLTHLRMVFVEVSAHGAAPASEAKPQPAAAPAAPAQGAPAEAMEASSAAAPHEDEGKVKFSKTY